MTAHAGWLLRHVGSTDTYALYNASMGTDTRVAQTSTTTKDGMPQASAGVLLPLHEEHCWPRAACQTPPARAVRLGVCRCRCGCDPAHPCRPLALDPTAGNPVADRCGNFFPHPILTETLSHFHAYKYFRGTYFEISVFESSTFFKVPTHADLLKKDPYFFVGNRFGYRVRKTLEKWAVHA